MKNKVVITTFFLFVSVSPYVFAQQEIKPTKRLKGGITASRLVNTDWESSTMPGFAFGLSLDFRLTHYFSVKPEVLYVEKGSRERVPSIDIEFDLTLDYVELPLLATFHLPTSGLLRPHIYLGPSFSFLIENNSNVELVDNPQPTPDLLIEEASMTDIGGVVGIGTDLHFTFNTMSAEIRYEAGFLGVFSGATPNAVQNRAVMLLIGFQF